MARRSTRSSGPLPPVTTPPSPVARGTRRASGILSGPVDAPPASRLAPTFPTVMANGGLKVTHRASGFGGTVVRVEAGSVEIEGRTGLVRGFRLVPGAFIVDGRTVTLVRPAPDPSAATERRQQATASGSVPMTGLPARVARAGRLWVEGVHDAELVERVWGDDLRIEGIVVERLDGIDHLERAVTEFRPGPARRLGILVDHLVEGSKESRLAGSVRHADVLVTGTPFVDVWQAVRPSVVGIEAWPEVPRGVEWKAGVCTALGWGDPPAAWRRILAAVNSYADLESSLVGAVERLIDFVTSED